tara:strand:+ start:171 stop:1688 length:1518 start_codon:yes stop_codon:yes gene_type:complete
MKENFKIVFCIVLAFLFSFLILGIFLDTYSQGLLTSEKNIITIGTIIDQNPKQITLDVLRNILDDVENDEVNINSLGFRGNEFSEIKPDNTFRIFLLGGSQMFGTGATSDNTTIPGYIEHYLSKNEYEFGIEIINSGLKGVDSRKELLLLENMLLKFSPDLVIVYDGLNDLRAGNSSGNILDNWNSMCKLGKENNFDVIITLQPIAGFGDKSLTQDELLYLQNGKDYENNSLINSLNQYEEYADNLEKLEDCTDEIDLRSVFDGELDSIYIDEAHVSDKGNSIVAKSLSNNIISNISKDTIQKQKINSEIGTTNSEMFLEFEYIVRTLFSNFEKNIILIPISPSEIDVISQEDELFKEISVKTQSQIYENDEIYIILKVFPSEEKLSKDKIIKLTTMDKTNNSMVNNVTYLMTVSKDGEKVFTDYFFTENELVIEVIQGNEENVKISGERRYELDALIMHPDSPITISGEFLNSGSNYRFDINLRTIHNTENFIFLNGFYVEISP